MIQSRPDDLRSGETGQTGTNSPGMTPQKRFGEETEHARQRAAESMHEAREMMRETGRRAKDEVVRSTRQTSAQMQEKAGEFLDERKGRAAEEVGVFGQALRRAAETLDENGDQAAGRYVHQAADMVDSCADWLHHKSASEMARSCGDFTRRHPEIVLGGLFVAGIAAARFLKASERQRDREDADFELRDSEFEGNFGEGHYGALSDMDRQNDLASHDPFGDGDEDYGDVGLYAGPHDETSPVASGPQTEDIPDVRSSQPGTPSPVTSGQPIDAPVFPDEDQSTSGGDEPSSETPTKPR